FRRVFRVGAIRGLLDLGLFIDHVLPDAGIIFLDLHLLRMQPTVLRRRVVMAGAGRRHQSDLFTHSGDSSSQTFSPRARKSPTTFSMPSLSMMRMPFDDTRSLTKRRSLSSQKRCVCRFGRKRRRVLLLAWETLLPVVGRFPVT